MLKLIIEKEQTVEIQPLEEAMTSISQWLEKSVQDRYLRTRPHLSTASPLYQTIQGYSGPNWAEVRAGEGLPRPYATIQQRGGVTHPTVTPQSRKFFWAMFYQTSENKWKWMALSKKTRFLVSIKANPYMELDDEDWNFIAHALGPGRIRVSTTFGAEVVPPR